MSVTTPFQLVSRGSYPHNHDPLTARRRLEQRMLPQTLRDFQKSAPTLSAGRLSS